MSRKTTLTREQIKAKTKGSLDAIELPVADWDGVVYIRALSLQDINDCNRKASDLARGGEINPNVRNGWYLVTGMVDPKITLEDAEEWLTDTAAGPVAVVLSEILTRSGLTERATDAAKSASEEEPDPLVSDTAS